MENRRSLENKGWAEGRVRVMENSEDALQAAKGHGMMLEELLEARQTWSAGKRGGNGISWQYFQSGLNATKQSLRLLAVQADLQWEFLLSKAFLSQWWAKTCACALTWGLGGVVEERGCLRAAAGSWDNSSEWLVAPLCNGDIKCVFFVCSKACVHEYAWQKEVIKVVFCYGIHLIPQQTWQCRYRLRPGAVVGPYLPGRAENVTHTDNPASISPAPQPGAPTQNQMGMWS